MQEIGGTEGGVRERLLASALSLFNEKGYAAASVREIVEAAGVTKPVLYYYFGSKEGLYLELLQGAYDSFDPLVAECVSSEGSAQEKIIQFCSNVLSACLQNLSIIRLTYSIYYGPPQGAPPFDFDTYFLRTVEIVESLVASGVASGELRDNSVHDVSRAVSAILTSAIAEQLARRVEKIDLEGMVRSLRLLMSGVAAAPSYGSPEVRHEEPLR